MTPRATRNAIILGLVILAAAVTTGMIAADPPHWTSPKFKMSCEKQSFDATSNYCHMAHVAAGGTITAAATNVALCQSCHTSSNVNALAYTLHVDDADKASPATGTGTSHNFNAAQVNATFGATAPANVQMQQRIYGGNIVCSTCHDEHAATSANGGTPRISPPVKVSGTGAGTVGIVATSAYTGAVGIWYTIELQSPATFRWSKDNGTTWVAQGVATGASVLLDNGITISFTGVFVTADKWQLYGAYPFLRSALDSGDNTTGAKFCRDCHASWVMDHIGTETWTGTYRSHPVGIVLNANAGNYDRALPLDGNGATQAVGDGNKYNDLRLDSTNRIQCWSCHGMHFTPSKTNWVHP